MARPSPRSPTLTFPDVAALLALFDDEPPPPAEPSSALGQQERVELYARRRAAGQQLFHPGDAIQDAAFKEDLPADMTD
jgi:hypothetical protein